MKQLHKDLLIAGILTAIMAIFSIVVYSNPSHGMLTTYHIKKYTVDNIFLKVKINGHLIKMQLDTGSDISFIPGKDVKKLGLDKLQPSNILHHKEKMTDANGHSSNQKTVDILMSIEGSKAFTTGITIDPKVKDCPPLLSLHDYFQDFKNITSH